MPAKAGGPKAGTPATIPEGMETQLTLFGGRVIEPVIEDPLADAFRRLAPQVRSTIVYTAAARRRIFSWKGDDGETAVTLRVGPEFREAPARSRRSRRPDRHPEAAPRDRAANGSSSRSGAGRRPRIPAGWPPGAPCPRRAAMSTSAPSSTGSGPCRFPEPVPARIGWTERPARHLMGRFEKGSPEGLIVINRLLDSPLAPLWYLDFLVYHELLHAVVPPRPGATRILVHPPEFRRAERSHPDHARARSFERWASGEGFRVLLDALRSEARLPREIPLNAD